MKSSLIKSKERYNKKDIPEGCPLLFLNVDESLLLAQQAKQQG